MSTVQSVGKLFHCNSKFKYDMRCIIQSLKPGSKSILYMSAIQSVGKLFHCNRKFKYDMRCIIQSLKPGSKSILYMSAIQSVGKLFHCNSKFKYDMRCISWNECCNIRVYFKQCRGIVCVFSFFPRGLSRNLQVSKNFHDCGCYPAQSVASQNCVSWRLTCEVSCFRKDSVILRICLLHRVRIIALIWICLSTNPRLFAATVGSHCIRGNRLLDWYVSVRVFEWLIRRLLEWEWNLSVYCDFLLVQWLRLDTSRRTEGQAEGT